MIRQADKAVCPGVIEPDNLYTKAELQARCQIKEAAWRAARKAGMRIKKVGNVRFVRGADFIEFVERVGTEEK